MQRSGEYWAHYHQLKKWNLSELQGFPEFLTWRQFMRNDMWVLSARHRAAMKVYWRSERRVLRLTNILALLGKDIFCTARVAHSCASATVRREAGGTP